MFTEYFRKRLEINKHTQWATDLSEDKVEALFWMSCEFGHCGNNLLEVIEKHFKEATIPRPACARAFIALKTIHSIVNGEDVDCSAVKKQIHETHGHTWEN
ncbi:MAG: hypothetical protein QME52_05255 [Bacteroidota bacterium]|nr:hypothetical protein [Bacteroidota bacterium]